MDTAISGFLLKGTGPAQLRTDLRRKTKVVRTYLAALAAIGMVPAKIPEGILGGDIFGVMSEPLRELLQVSKEPENNRETIRKARSRFTDGAEISGENRIGEFPASSELAEEGRSRFNPSQFMPPQQDTSFSRPDWSETGQEAGTPFAPLQVRTSYEPALESEIASQFIPPQQDTSFPRSDWSETRQEAGTPFTPLPVQASSELALESEFTQLQAGVLSDGQEETTAERPSHRGQAVPPLLVQKLDEYWQLSQPQAALNQGPQFSSAGNETASSSVAPQSPTWFTPPASSPWPEMMGRQTAEKIRRMLADPGPAGSSRQVQQTLNKDLPEKVEIQNVFNIEMKRDRHWDVDSTTTLSDTIADIMREQALQHGIDIT